MGATYSTLQLQYPQNTTPEQFTELLYRYYGKSGLIPATPDEAEYSYWLAFPEDSS